MTDSKVPKQKYVVGSLGRKSQGVGTHPGSLQERLLEHFGPATLSILLPPLGSASPYLRLAEAGHLLSAVGFSHTAVAAAYLEAYRWGVYDRCQFTAVKEGESPPYLPGEFDVIVRPRRGASNFPTAHEPAGLLKQGGLLVRSDDGIGLIVEE